MNKKINLSDIPDWSREEKHFLQWLPSISLIRSIRSFQKSKNNYKLFSTFFSAFSTLRWKFWSVITGSDIGRETKIGGGLILPHPNGVVIHRDVIIGVNCMIMQQSTIGQLADGAVPVLGTNVYIGAGAKILGGITIGNNVNVGANAVVITNVPNGCTAVGVPAKIVKKK